MMGRIRMQTTPWASNLAEAITGAGLTLITTTTTGGWVAVTVEEYPDEGTRRAAVAALESAGFDRVRWFDDAHAVACSQAIIRICAERDARLATATGDHTYTGADGKIYTASMADYARHAANMAIQRCCCCDDMATMKGMADAYCASDCLTYAGVPK